MRDGYIIKPESFQHARIENILVLLSAMMIFIAHHHLLMILSSILIGLKNKNRGKPAV
jgi:hypothetical protein